MNSLTLIGNVLRIKGGYSEKVFNIPKTKISEVREYPETKWNSGRYREVPTGKTLYRVYSGGNDWSIPTKEAYEALITWLAQ